jgi:general secretion pathway protein H
LRRSAAFHRQAGFTLLEILVVVVIAGITLGLVSLNVMPSERKVLENEAQRISLLMQLARDEAIVRNQPIALEFVQNGYRFLVRDNNEWRLLTRDEELRERRFPIEPVMVSINPAPILEEGRLRVVFGREPVDRPFLLTMVSGDAAVSVRADGIGHFVVE